MATDFKKVVCILVDEGILTVDQVNQAIKKERASKRPTRSGPTWESAKRLVGELNTAIEANGLKPFKADVSSVACMELIIRNDGHSEETIREIIKFSQSDLFWYTVVLSPEKLRKNFDALMAQHHKDKKPVQRVDNSEQVRESMRKYDERWEKRRAEAVPMPANFKDILRKGKQ